MRHDPPLGHRVHRIALVALFSVVALLFCLGVVLAAEPSWYRVVDMIDTARGLWRSW